MRDFSEMDPMEKDRLLNLLVEERSNGYTPDMQSLLDAIQYIVERQEQLEERHDLIEKVVMDDLIAGIEEMYNTNQRKTKAAGLSERFGGDLGTFLDPYKKAYGNDLFEDLLDELEERKGGWDREDEDWDDEKALPSIIEEIKEQMGGIMGLPGVDAAAVKVDAKEAMGEDGDGDEDMDLIKKLAKKSKY